MNSNNKGEKKNGNVFRVVHGMHKLWIKAFGKTFIKETPNKEDKCSNVGESSEVSEADSSEPIPFRLSKYDILPQMFHVNVKVKSAVKSEEIPIPDWGAATPYPFSNIVGGSLWDGLAAASGYEAGYLRDKYQSDKFNADDAIAKQQSTYADAVPTDAVIFYHKIDISNKKDLNKDYGNPLAPTSANNVYMKVPKQYLIQQAYDIDENGEIVINPSYHGHIIRPVGRSKNRNLCKLVKLNWRDISSACHIEDPQTCLNYFMAIKPIIRNNRADSSEYGNPRYGKFDEYFSKFGCVAEDGTIDVNKFETLFRSGKVTVMGFVSDFLMKYMLLSDYEKTYVWVNLNSVRAKPFTDKDVKIANAALGMGESVSESSDVNEAIKGLSDNVGDIIGDTWREAFFNSIVSAKQQASKRVLTFVTKGHKKKVEILNDVLNQGVTGYMREFIYIDDVESDVKGLDYSSFFSDDRFAEMLDGASPREFTCKKISGYCIGFPYIDDVEAARLAEQKKRAKIDNRKFLDDYLAAYGMSRADLAGFHVTLVCPKGSGNDIKSYFFFRGYDVPKNPKAEGIEPPSDEVMSSILPSDENSLLSAIWYNESTSPSTGKINLPTNARASQTSASGRSVGYKNAKIAGGNS